MQLQSSGTGDMQFLLEEAVLRRPSSQVHDSGAGTFTVGHDKAYIARDEGIESTRELQACRTARLARPSAYHCQHKCS